MTFELTDHPGKIYTLNILKKRMKATIREVYSAIDTERTYQNVKWGTKPHSIQEWLTYINSYVDEALYLGAREPDSVATPKQLEIIRKIAGLATVVMEEHGAPERKVQGGSLKQDNHGLDTDTHVLFYEQDFYPFSNFSSFTILWKGGKFDTSEAVYHWEKFPLRPDIQLQIQHAPSAHEAFKIAERNKAFRRPDWDLVKVDIMYQILKEKVKQHEYVQRKLVQSGNRVLVENSWRDTFWGWGPNKDGQNMLGKTWMRIRDDFNSGKL